MLSLRVPATTANLGPGFDSMSLALKIYNTFTFKEIDNGIRIKINDKACIDTIELSLEENLIYKSMQYLYKKTNRVFSGIEVIEDVAIPFARGLGSSATAIIAGLMGANFLLGNFYTEKELLKMAIEIEGHSDNIISAFIGGFVISVDGSNEAIYKKIELPEDLALVLIIPDFQLQTDQLRKILPRNIPHRDAVFNLGRTALLTASLYEKDWKLLSIAMDDRLHQSYRSKLIPGFDDVIAAAYYAGARGVALSGSGPSILAVSPENSKGIGEAMVDAFARSNIKSRYIITYPDNKGIIIKNY
jgi:homoserine kinase